jgi:hypothetical protein
MAVKVTLNIESDEELRAYIKDCIKGQVMSIVREDFEQMVMEELDRKLKAKSSYYFDQMVENAMQKAVRGILYEQGVSDWNTIYIQPHIEKIVKKSMEGKDWGKLIDDAVKTKLRSLIQ